MHLPNHLTYNVVKVKTQEGPVADIVPFEDWYSKLKIQAMELFHFTAQDVEKFDEKTWREYYLDGFTPKDALEEETST